MVRYMVNDGDVWIIEPMTYGDQSWLCCLKRAGHDGFCTASSHFGWWNMWIYVDVSHDLVICREMYHHFTPFEEFRRVLHDDLMFDDFENLGDSVSHVDSGGQLPWFLHVSIGARALWLYVPDDMYVSRFLAIDLHWWLSGWWFGTCFIFPYIEDNHHPNWLSYFSEGWPNHQPVMFGEIQFPDANNKQPSAR